LVTSSTHVRRAMACFAKQGIDVQPYAVQKRVGIRRWELDFLLVPQTENLGKWSNLVHEWVGYVSYRVRGYC
ncbi:MAG: YdcF family protein, partial [Flavobacteriales bacterium]|nr:YdcF family protein [Flavobacteriales bacterium]